MEIIPKNLKHLANLIAQMPGMTARQALRAAYALTRTDQEAHPFSDLEKLIKAGEETMAKLKICSLCFMPFETDDKQLSVCPVCADKRRDHQTLVIVEKETDLLSLEKTDTYNGLYFVLGGLLASIDPENNQKLRVRELKERIKRQKNIPQARIKEVIIALGQTTDGNLTANYLKGQIQTVDKEIKISRLASGLPHGSEVEFADEETLSNALKYRQEA
ncbi:MAG TPA: toprim domain-containing protein [Candidatus Paceibacterota bacterium]|nr:toprim domain-containing protein [Candidatus Paceibacterota bacterium]